MGRVLVFLLVNVVPGIFLYLGLRRRDLASTPEGSMKWMRCTHCVHVGEVGPGMRLLVPWKAGLQEWLPVALVCLLLPKAAVGWPGAVGLVLAWSAHLATRKKVSAVRCPKCGKTGVQASSAEEFERHLTMNSHK